MMMHIILCHENADFDAVGALLAASKLYPEALAVLPERLNRNVQDFWMLYRNGLPFIERAQVPFAEVARVTLVDTQRLPQIKKLSASVVVNIIDHHSRSGEPTIHETAQIEEVGAATTLVVEHLQRLQSPPLLTSLEATLIALGIYEDTGSLAYRKTTPRDLHAAAWLLEQGAVLDHVRRFLEPMLNDSQQSLLERLVQNADTRLIQGYRVTLGTASLEDYIDQVSMVAHRLRDLLDPTALFLLIEMSGIIQLVGRSTDDAIDAGEIARFFGGGGHGRAAAAPVKGMSLNEAVETLWRQLTLTTQPATRVADIMSLGVQTVDATTELKQVVSRLRRIGHEGYPVIEGEVVVGLLTRRDMDRAVEHDLAHLPVRSVMSAGTITILQTASIPELEQRIVTSGWGQIPVVNEASRLIGIVTRTDLITYWAQNHPRQATEPAQITTNQMIDNLGASAVAIIDHIATVAQRQNLNVYLVGGVVRDLLLERPTHDLDFVVEGDAIAFATSLAAEFGGDVTSFRPFGTAKWRFNLPPDTPNEGTWIDFATARNEFYEHPTALPSVYNGSIKLDLLRRDFTINTLAVQLSPIRGRLLDFYGGLNDLQSRVLRVLHNLSFVDDPTRILRAVRFEWRLGFQIEARTTELIQIALPMLRRITGERVRNELTLLLRERDPAGSLALLQERGILAAIHPDFIVTTTLSAYTSLATIAIFEKELPTLWVATDRQISAVLWLIVLASHPTESMMRLIERLIFGKTVQTDAMQVARILQNELLLAAPATRPSQIVRLLNEISPLALIAGWIMVDDPNAKDQISRYANTWQYIRPIADGHSLQARGLRPSRCFSVLLDRLKTAWLDDEIQNWEQEEALLSQLIATSFCDDNHPKE